jgi:hypothetical protein
MRSAERWIARSTDRVLLDQLVLRARLRLPAQLLLQVVVEVLGRVVVGRVGRQVEELDLVGVAP